MLNSTILFIIEQVWKKKGDISLTVNNFNINTIVSHYLPTQGMYHIKKR